MGNHVRYFAYGSNMHPRRMRLRAPSAISLGVASLHGYRLAFHKRGADGSGKCSVVRTGLARDAVYGVLYRISHPDAARLHEAEGLGRGYEAVEHEVVSAGERRSCYFYIAGVAYVDDGLHPFRWYKDYVCLGAAFHGLPTFYVREIEATRSMPDPDTLRDAHHAGILQGLDAVPHPALA